MNELLFTLESNIQNMKEYNSIITFTEKVMILYESGDIKSDTIFSIKLAEQFKERKGKVSKEQMKKMLLNNPSVFVKNTLGGIVSDLFESSNDIV